MAYKWLNLWADSLNGYTFVFASCRDIHCPYSMRKHMEQEQKGYGSKSEVQPNNTTM